MKRRIWIGLLFFLSGVLLSICFGKTWYEKSVLLTAANLKAYCVNGEDLSVLLGRVLFARGKLFFFLWILLMTRWQTMIKNIGKYILIFGLGIFGGIAMEILGIWGVILTIAVVFPHGIFYVLTIVGMCRVKVQYDRYGKRKNTRFFLQILLLGLLFLIGVWSECVFGVPLQKQILKWYYFSD